METLPLDPTLYKTLLEFAPCFTSPSFKNFLVVISGWIQCVNRRTITGISRRQVWQVRSITSGFIGGFRGRCGRRMRWPRFCFCFW